MFQCVSPFLLPSLLVGFIGLKDGLPVWIERGSPRDQVIVTVFLIIIAGLVVVAFCKSKLDRSGWDLSMILSWKVNRRSFFLLCPCVRETDSCRRGLAGRDERAFGQGQVQVSAGSGGNGNKAVCSSFRRVVTWRFRSMGKIYTHTQKRISIGEIRSRTNRTQSAGVEQP